MAQGYQIACVVCSRPAAAPASAGTCAACADDSATLELHFDLKLASRTLTRTALAARPRNHWRYLELLPVRPDAQAMQWPVGFTPIVEAPRLAEWAGVRRLRLKDEGRNPTASFKDRASSVGVVHARQAGATRIACASTGNAASSLAGYAAMAGLPATIFVPARAPLPKVTQLCVYGADVRRVRGSYAEAYALCSSACEREGWYNRNCAINPYLVEGKKTCGLEIAEQTGDDPPDWVAVSVGDGCTVAGIGKGLMEMTALGFLAAPPRLLAVQPAAVAPIAHAWQHGALPDPRLLGTTFADSIDVAVPRNWRKAIDRVRACDGAFLCVTDAEIEQALLACARLSGVFAEPAAAAALAGVRRAVAEGRLTARSDVLVVITGSGLKDVQSAARLVSPPTDVDPITGDAIANASHATPERELQ